MCSQLPNCVCDAEDPRDPMDSNERSRAWAMIADRNAEVARIRAKNLELYRKISELATDAYDLTVRAEAAEDVLKAIDKSWSESFPQGPDGKFEFGLDIADEHKAFWRDARRVIATVGGAAK